MCQQFEQRISQLTEIGRLDALYVGTVVYLLTPQRRYTALVEDMTIWFILAADDMPPPKQSRQNLAAELEELLHKYVDSGAPGISAATASSGEIVWESAKGQSDILGNHPLDVFHHFGIGSITKVFVAVIILQLVDESKLAFSNTVDQILDPELYAGIENAGQASIERLLSHHAGIDSWEDEPSWIVRGRGKDIRNDHIWGKTEALDYIRRPRVTAPEPGQGYYSNTNYTLLGLMIEGYGPDCGEGDTKPYP